ncbi:peptidoglycan-binding domain-containing protein [Streptomyces formicae]|uniref:Peptidoglycan binding-like domain-containing protein n=1 Tax=Streptomyces formicae TaxID=1616117 RepID=A0A291QE88_9ACTN|nr:peptidoglycan-binding domain-containing protein [Streptomyces formicae]ATL30019.1 hypothetical protein KY5_5001c [Streptomyces formicae]
MTHHHKAATVLAAGLLAATAATGVAATTASAAEPTAPSVSASCSWRTNLGFYCGYDTRNVYSDYGDSGRQVKEIQALLRFRGIGIGPDGIDGRFGKDTRSAVKKFQRSWHLNDDGIVGPNTWTYLRTGV